MTDTNRQLLSSNGRACRPTCLQSSACWWESPAVGSSADPRVQRPPRVRRRTHPPLLPRRHTRAHKHPPLLNAENGRHPSWTFDREAQGRPEKSPTSGKHRKRLLRRPTVSHGHRLLPAGAEIGASRYRRSHRHGNRYWYTGNPDAAIAEFKKSLSYEPNKANTLFNLGVVEWQGKMDVDQAVATWQKLLDTNPNYADKDKVLQLMAQAKKHSGIKAGTPAKPLS